MKMISFVGTSALLLALGVAAPAHAQDQHDDADKPKQQEPKPEENKPPKTPNDQPRPDKEKQATPPKEQPRSEDPKTAKQEEKQNEQPQKEQEKAQKEQEKSQQRGNEQQRQYAQQGGGQESRGGGRIPDDRFKAHFGREHHFHVGHPEVVGGRPRFSYGGYSFIIVQPWPADWGYDDDVYVVDDGGVYYLCDVAHPGVQLELNVVL